MEPIVFIRRAYGVSDDSKNPFPLPVNIRRVDIPNIIGTSTDFFKHYVCSWKVDGERVHLVFLDGLSYIVNRKDETKSMELNHPYLDGTIFDCELIGDVVLVFDLVVCRHDTSVGLLPYHQRHQVAGELIDGMKNVKMKPIFQITEYVPTNEYKTDGVIFTPVHQRVSPQQGMDIPIYKWKPPHEHTIDLLVRGNMLYDSSGKVYTGYFKDLGQNVVWEFRYNNGRLEHVRPRTDKERGNSRFIIDSTLESQKENILLSELLLEK